YPLAIPRGHFITVVGNSFSAGSTTTTSSLGVAYGTNTYFTVSAAGSSGQLNIPWFSIGY
ncbi:hypothetical protein, partial [Pseudomonas japonica]|uniref:hypothetical protein n=1 Tax=Pseudomonas japonica TaxID=256466 RepID=UPI003A865E11